MPIENVQAVERGGSVDRWLDESNARTASRRAPAPNPLDSPAMERRRTQLLEWYEQERERQAPNRYQMAIDCDYYDSLQWADEDAQELLDRGQAPLVFNESAVAIDWIIGTEKRTRVDFKVLPRAEDDVKNSDVKTKTLKYLGDINHVPFNRSRAFEDAVKAGVGWLEDGVRDDPSEEPIFSRYESWRRILWDSLSKELNLSDARYIFRDLWADLDVAIAMFPNRRARLKAEAVSYNLRGNDEDEDFWYLGQHYQARDERGEVIGRRTFVSDLALSHNRRPRVKLIECWYRRPTNCRYCSGGEFDGVKFDSSNAAMKMGLKMGAFSLYDRLEMQVRCAIMTEQTLLQDMPSPYRHNRFPFTPIWCYRRDRDGMPYGPMRRMRDPQDDLNKRMSKALFLLSTNRTIADHDAFEDPEEAREEIARPDAFLIKKRGSEVKVENNLDLSAGQAQLGQRSEQFIQKVGGVTDELMGRRTNAVSGEAIKARQLQGSVVTAGIFDNLRFAVQNQGEIQLSLTEQFMTQEKVIRVTGAKKGLPPEFIKINQPETGSDGVTRYVNDITARQADFKVDEQDFSQSLRQAMFESMSELVGKISQLNPEAGLRILKMALEFSDFPNKDEMATEIADILGMPNKPIEDMSPEERQAWDAKVAQQQQAGMLQQAGAEAELKEKMAKVEKILADAEKSRQQAAQIQLETQMQIKVLAEGVNKLTQLVETSMRITT
jgi:hypothetical protein